MKPRRTDYVILKTSLSDFYQTPLEGMLRLRVRTLITGFAADNCVLFTAADGYMRDYRLVGPSRLCRSPDDGRRCAGR